MRFVQGGLVVQVRPELEVAIASKAKPNADRIQRHSRHTFEVGLGYPRDVAAHVQLQHPRCAVSQSNVEMTRLIARGCQSACQDRDVGRRSLETLVARLRRALLPADRQLRLPAILLHVSILTA